MRNLTNLKKLDIKQSLVKFIENNKSLYLENYENINFTIKEDKNNKNLFYVNMNKNGNEIPYNEITRKYEEKEKLKIPLINEMGFLQNENHCEEENNEIFYEMLIFDKELQINISCSEFCENKQIRELDLKSITSKEEEGEAYLIKWKFEKNDKIFKDENIISNLNLKECKFLTCVIDYQYGVFDSDNFDYIYKNSVLSITLTNTFSSEIDII